MGVIVYSIVDSFVYEGVHMRFPLQKSLVENIRLHFEEHIIAGKLKPRQRLVEEEIARKMGVSPSY